jgi:phage tail-like protein
MAKGLPGLSSDALASYTFSIEIDRTEIAQFSEVSGLASEVDVIELKENTIDGKLVIHKTPGAIKPATVTLKRAKNSSTELWKWHEAVTQGKLGDARRNGSIVMKGFDGSEVARYNF